uniref:Cilia- and flagella-associated protein 97 n=1 Tax=Ciona intestinalis TaxID=7719 RepID=F6TA62_CIOIN|nr:cilia- and flagella-associated protein 97 [Ciona intestinalis]|eukprot:XP_002129621.1 cilia- and flagella-associated protein 97 [Ciona intestinalis]
MDNVVDHDFFDDPPTFEGKRKVENNSKSFLSQFQSSSSEDELTSRSHTNLHGTNGRESGDNKQSTPVKNKTPQNSSPSYENDFESSSDEEDDLSDEGAGEHMNKIHVQVNRKQRDQADKRNNKHDDDSSDSVTDVSPLSSPDMSPNMNRRKIKAGKHHKGGQTASKHIDYINVQHVPKLNVSFKTPESNQSYHDRHVPIIKERNKSNNKYHEKLSSYADYLSSSDEETHHRFDGRRKPDARQNRALENHRQRLLSSTAMESKDISHLLETVLGFEQKAQENRYAERQHERMRPNSEQASRRKNMSFSNQQVREIDRENRRLLNEITKSTRKQQRPSSASSVRSVSSIKSDTSNRSRQSMVSHASSTSSYRKSNKSPTKLYHSAINRINYQRQIERENLKMLKRLRSCKSTPGLGRKTQLSEYKKQKGFMGSSIDRNGMSMRKARELTQNAEVVKEVLGKSEGRYSAKPAWQDSW